MHNDFGTFKEELKSRIDLCDIVSEYVELKKKGASYLGLCPFHTEKTASFTVNRERQFYHCFGCGKGGDVFSFLMDITGMSFMEAVEQLAERTGLHLPEKEKADPGLRAKTDLIIAANLAAAEYFHKCLNSDEGRPALDYLLGRGLSQETIRTFRLGYAPSGTGGLVKFAKSRGVDQTSLESAGILIAGSYGRPPLSRFGERVIFPIIDQAARIIGFGGRLLAGDGAKYVNSPESVVYHKSKVLFGVYQARQAVKHSHRVIVVEGYMDVISLHQAGIHNVVAASGTSFTTEQGRMISRIARDAVLLFDGDSAGITAAARGADNLLATDISITVAVLPEGHDPDSFVREKGADALREFLDNPLDIWEFKLKSLGRGDTTPEERVKLASEIADSISLIGDELKREVFIREMSLRLGIDINSMRKAVYGRIARKNRSSSPTSKNSQVSLSDRELLGSILLYPPLAKRFLEEADTSPFSCDLMRKIAEEIFHRSVEGLEVSPSALLSAFPDRETQEIITASASLPITEETASKHVESNIRRFHERELRREIAEFSIKISHEPDSLKKTAYLKKQEELYNRLKKLIS